MTDYEKITEQFFSVNFFVLESSSNLEKLKIIFTYNGLDCFLNFIYFFLGCTATVPVSRLSLVVASGLLIVAASPVAEHGPQGSRVSVVAACSLQSTGSVVVVPRLSSFTACGIFPCLLHWQEDSLSTVPPGKSLNFLLNSLQKAFSINIPLNNSQNGQQ